MQDDKNPRNADPQTGKRSRELPDSTLWLRDKDEEAPSGRVERDPTNSRDKTAAAQDQPAPVAANDDGKSSKVGAGTPAKAEAAQFDAAEIEPTDAGAKQKPQEAQPTSAAHVTTAPQSIQVARSTQATKQPSAAPRVPDGPAATKSVGEATRDVLNRTMPVHQTVVNGRDGATGIARDESGFAAWPTTADEPRLIERPFFTTERPLLTPLLGAAALVGLALAAWSFTVLEETRAQLTSITTAKTAVDQSLADAQRRLEATEKAIADVQKALGKPTGAAAAKAAPPKP